MSALSPLQLRQPSLFGHCPVTAAVEELARASAEERGAASRGAR